MDTFKKENSGSTIFHQKHSMFIRIWHWLLFFLISASMITVLLNATLLNPHKNSSLLQDQLNKFNINITNEQASKILHKYEDQVWEIHKLLGYGLAFLLLSRFITELMLPKEEKIKNRLVKALGIYRKSAAGKGVYLHYIRVKQVYMVFYILLFIMSVTGLAMIFNDELHITRNVHHIIKTIHNFGQYAMYSFVLLHIGGIIIAENNKFPGIVSGMIHGKLK